MELFANNFSSTILIATIELEVEARLASEFGNFLVFSTSISAWMIDKHLERDIDRI
jgi:hypothetical protein